MAGNIGGLVDNARGLLSRRIFIEPEIYREPAPLAALPA